MTPAEQVERSDPDRFLAVMAAPPQMRADLFTLYAVNLELARAAWASQEPMVALMRLQFWRDLLDGQGMPGAGTHPLAGPLQDLIARHDLPIDAFVQMIDMRARDTEPAGEVSAPELLDYLRGTSGNLLLLAARVTGRPADETALSRGTAQGMANYFLAVPALIAAGRKPLPDLSVPDLAQMGLDLLHHPPRGPAFLVDWRAKALLTQALRHPQRVTQGGLAQSEFARRGSLLWRALRG